VGHDWSGLPRWRWPGCARWPAPPALASLGKAIDVCAGGGDAEAVQQAIDAYNADFERLSERIEAAGP
jgi:hypothetical protein